MRIKEYEKFNVFKFDNKFSKNKVSCNDRILKRLTLLKYKVIKFLGKYKFINKTKLYNKYKNKSIYRILELYYDKESEMFKNTINHQIEKNTIFIKGDLELNKIICYDLLPKEYLNDYLKKYMKFKKKFSKPCDFYILDFDIKNQFNNMIKSRDGGNWYNIDFLWLKNDCNLGKYFEKIKIQSIALTESFFVMKYELIVNERVNENLFKILSSNVFVEPEFFSNDKWYKKNSIAGLTNTGQATDEAKNSVIENFILELKAAFFKEIKKHLITIFFDWKNVIPSLEIYTSRSIIQKGDKIANVLEPYSSNVFEVNKGNTIYFIYKNKFSKKRFIDSTKIVADYDLMKSNNGVYEFMDIEKLLTNSLADYYLLNGLENKISELIDDSQIKINKIINSKKTYNSLLKLKINIEKKLYFYRRLYLELERNVECKLENNRVISNYEKIFNNKFSLDNPDMNYPIKFKYRYEKVYFKIKQNNQLINTIYNHFDENSKLLEIRYNYKMVNWSLVVAIISLIVSIVFSFEPNVWKTILEFLQGLFSK